MKSGEIIDSDPRTKVRVIWPHIGIRNGTNQQRVSYDDLTPADLSLGFIKCLTEQIAKEARRGLDSAVSDAMFEFFHAWTDDSREYAWESVRGYIKLVYLAMEQGDLTWRDTARIEKICAKAIERGDKLPKPAGKSSIAQSMQSAAVSKHERTLFFIFKFIYRYIDLIYIYTPIQVYTLIHNTI
jgi:hypothetical protein